MEGENRVYRLKYRVKDREEKEKERDSDYKQERESTESFENAFVTLATG
jgi:hypothetical protein